VDPGLLEEFCPFVSVEGGFLPALNPYMNLTVIRAFSGHLVGIMITHSMYQFSLGMTLTNENFMKWNIKNS